MHFQEHISSILLVGTENPIALSVIRALAMILPDTPIHTLAKNTGKRQSSRYSRYIHSHHTFIGSTESELFDELSEHINSSEATILLPVDEYFVRLLAAHEQDLKQRVHLPPLPKPDLFDQLVHKQQLSEWVVRHGFPSAFTLPLAKMDPDSIGNDFFPCLLKPVRGTSGWGVTLIRNAEELNHKLQDIDITDYILQEFIPGMDIGCSILAVEGQILAHTIQKVLVSNGFSFSTAIRFEQHEQLIDQVQDVVTKSGYSGLAHLDFRLDERDGQPKLTDFNARVWHSILGSRAAGVDFVELYCMAALDIPFAYPPYTDCTYLMGKQSIKYYGKRILRPLSSRNKRTSTDLPDRIKDPLPEFIRLMQR